MTPENRMHQFIKRETGAVVTETLYYDKLIQWIYCTQREKMPFLFHAITSGRMTGLLGAFNYDIPTFDPRRLEKIVRALNIDMEECCLPLEKMTTPRKLFERQIRYWERRPMPRDSALVVSPADARMMIGSFSEQSLIFIKEKFFGYDELLGDEGWMEAFAGGDFAVFRLTPEKYHYNHVPASGKVVDFYEITGRYHSCNPAAVVTCVTPYSKNRRSVTIIDTDVEGGSRLGLVAMVEVVAMMIGDIVQCYSENRYESPRQIVPGMMLRRGQPKSLFRPGSSVDVLIFQKDRIRFSDDIRKNLHHPSAVSRFSKGFGQPLIETEVKIRQEIARGAFYND